MIYYKINPDNSVSVRNWRDLSQVKEGYEPLPAGLGHSPLYYANGQLTNEKPQAIIDQEEADEQERMSLLAEKQALIASLTFADIDNHIENVFGSLNANQKTSLKRLYKVVLYLAKQTI